MTEVTQQHPALQLFDAGYEDLISIAPPNAKLAPYSTLKANALGKTPARRTKDGWVGFAGWSDHPTTRRDVERWIADGASIGLRTRNSPFIDVDVEDAKLADDIAIALRRLFGVPLLQRFGRPPRFAIPFRTDEPFGKSKFTFLARDGTSQGGIDILADGAQCVVHGPHPTSGGDYFWMDGNFKAGVELLAARSPNSLPVLSANIVERHVYDVLLRVASRRGWTLERTVRSRSRQASSVAQSTLRAPSLEALRQAVKAIPNDQEFDSRDAWLRQLVAIKAAAGPNHEADALDTALDWSAAWAGPNDPEYVRTTWQSLHAPFAVGWSLLDGQAREHGFNSAAFEFDALTEAAADTASVDPSAPGESVDVLHVAEAVATDGAKLITDAERIAAMHGDPVRAFFMALPELQDGQLLACWNSLQTAATSHDRLTEVFRSVVLPAAKRLGVTPDEPRRYDVVLQAELEQLEHPKWVSASSEDRCLLRRAAFALFTNLPGLTSRANDGPGDELSLINVARDDLVSGLIPAKAVAAFVGLPGQGKTFLAIELATRVAKQPELDEVTQRPAPEKFGGREVQHGSVLYFTSEDADGNRSRLSRWSEANGAVPHLHLFGRVPPLSALDRTIVFMLEALRRALTEDSPPLKLIVIDVLRAAIEGEENSSDVVSPAMVAASVIGRMTGATVLLVHHAALSAPARGRGSSAFTAAMDFIGAVSITDDTIALKVEKNKNGLAGGVSRWHIAENVLHDGEARKLAAAAVVADAAEHAVVAVFTIAGSDRAVSRRQLADAMIADHPALYGSDTNKHSTAETRISRGIRVACSNSWLIENKEKYRLGPAAPSTLMPLGDLSEVLG